MINVKSEIYKGLKAVTDNVTDAYPSDWESFPVVVGRLPISYGSIP